MQKDEAYREMYAAVGELVLIATALDFQLNQICIALFELPAAPMVEPVVASLNSSRKIEMIKARAAHFSAKDWKQGLKSHVEAVEAVNRARNNAAHSVISIRDGRPVLTSPAAAKLLKTINLATKKAEVIQTEDLRSSIQRGEAALGSGQSVLENLEKLRDVRQRRAGLGIEARR